MDSCDTCSGTGVAYINRNGSISIGPCPDCGDDSDDDTGFSVIAEVNDWKAKIIEVKDGNIKLNELSEDQIIRICNDPSIRSTWKTLFILISELSKLRRENESLRIQISNVENDRWLKKIWEWMIK